MFWVGIFYLGCLAVFLEFVYRAKEQPVGAERLDLQRKADSPALRIERAVIE